MRAHTSSRSIVLGGLTSGVVVGIYDGVRAALHTSAGHRGWFSSAVLAGSVDLLVGGALGVGIALLIALARWGRRRGAPPAAVWPAWALVGVAGAAVSGLAIVGTAGRNNRFLAAGIVASVALVAAFKGALVGPALARFIAPLASVVQRRLRKGAPLPLHHEPAPSPVGVAVLAPVVALLLSGLVFLIVWRTRAPLSPTVRATRIALAGAVVVLMPALLAMTSGLFKRVPLYAALGGFLVVIVLPLALFANANWEQHLKFVPWRDIRIVVAILIVGAGLSFAFDLRRPRALVLWPIFLLAPPLAAALVLWAGGDEAARKATAGEGGLVGPLLAMVRPLLDFDHDHYPGLLGGGDCNDHDPRVNPGAQDWPEDGIDQDCDGRDLRLEDLRPPPLHPVPASVPSDLNVLLIVIDTLRADHLGVYGYDRPTSAALDRLAADGTLFENAWAHAPSTRYSLPAIVTGRWPSAIKWDMSIWWPGIARDQRTIAEAMRDAGYFTGAYYAYSYFNRVDARGFERGVQQYDDRLAAKHVNVGGPAESVGTSAREMADDGIDFLRAYKDQKFFLSLHFYDPHLNYERHPDAPNFGAAPMDLYDGEIWFTDKHLGRVIDELKRLGLYDKTAIVVTGDHGEGFGEHRIFAHGYDLYAPQTKVPLIVRIPGLPPRRVKDPVGHVDIAPTLINLARAKPEPSFVGRSVVDLVAGQPEAPLPGPVYQEVSFEPLAPGTASTERRALATATHHLIWKWVPENAVYCFDTQADPGELHDLWETPAGEPVCRGLKAELDRKLSLLKLGQLPPDFVDQLSRGVSAPGATAPAPSTPREARFGTAARFLGYDVKVVGTPFPGQGPPAPDAQGPGGTHIVRIARGGDIEVTTHLEVTGDLAGWRIFFHLDGPGGTWHNLDHTPVGGAYPVERWRPGQKIRDRFTVHFGADYAPGLHTLYVGFWHPPSAAHKRLPVTPADVQDGGDRLRVVTFSVE